jgi:hypothetical protein
MKYLLGEAGLVERVPTIMLEDDGLVRRYYRLRRHGSGQTRGFSAEIVHAEAIRRSGLTARRLGRPGVRV